ncbi:hypothetical protein AB0A94_08945 [Streptomyces sp. NPDC044984]|uniref:hypothetical protein n=1 Tax=Streptomyces sp. NPDC044984 TaxID=3154335 RepID=UPI0033FD11FD
MSGEAYSSTEFRQSAQNVMRSPPQPAMSPPVDSFSSDGSEFSGKPLAVAIRWVASSWQPVTVSVWPHRAKGRRTEGAAAARAESEDPAL